LRVHYKTEVAVLVADQYEIKGSELSCFAAARKDSSPYDFSRQRGYGKSFPAPRFQLSHPR
jgi:hypothetical protein